MDYTGIASSSHRIALSPHHTDGALSRAGHPTRAAARSRCLFISLAKDGERDPEKLCNAALRILCRQVTHRTRVDASERRVGNGTWPRSSHRTAVCYPFGEAGPP